MMAVLRLFQAANVGACFDEITSGPDYVDETRILDINALRNAPAKTPADYLDRLIWHSDCYQYEVAAGPLDITVNHAALATKTVYIGVVGDGGGYMGDTPYGVAIAVTGDQRETSTVIYTHGLGFVPKAFAVQGGRVLPATWIVQNAGANGSRTVSIGCDANFVYMREVASAGAGNLPATSVTYSIILTRSRAKDPAKPMLGRTGDNVVLARGIIDTNRQYLRRTGVGDSPFSLNMGVTLDIANGAARSASGGTVVSEAGYSGGLAAPPFVAVGV